MHFGRLQLLTMAVVGGLCAGGSAAAAGSGEQAGSKRVTVYRGLYVQPNKYDPQRWASNLCYKNWRLVQEKVPEIWFHTRLDGALSYASGAMTPRLAPPGTGKLSRSIVLELALPPRLLIMEKDRGTTGDRGWFMRTKVADDRPFLSRVGVVNLREGRTIKWMSPEAFFKRYPGK
jgi:hypothetical protein